MHVLLITFFGYLYEKPVTLCVLVAVPNKKLGLNDRSHFFQADCSVAAIPNGAVVFSTVLKFWLPCNDVRSVNIAVDILRTRVKKVFAGERNIAVPD